MHRTSYLVQSRVSRGLVLGWLLVGCGSIPDAGAPAAGENQVSTTEAINGGNVETGYTGVGCMQFAGGPHCCSAELLSSTVALTAAHCLGGGMTFKKGNNPSDFVTYHVDANLAHPGADLLLLHLSSPVSGATALTLNTGALPAKGAQCTEVGFGRHHTDGDAGSPYTTDEKRSAMVKVDSASADDIKVEWLTGIHDEGDSGGAFICGGKLAGINDLAPINSWPYTVADVDPVDSTWISANMGLAPPTVTNSLYAVDDGKLYRIDDDLGNYEAVATKDTGTGALHSWNSTTSMTNFGGFLYIIDNSHLNQVDPSTGVVTVLGGADWDGPTHARSLKHRQPQDAGRFAVVIAMV